MFPILIGLSAFMLVTGGRMILPWNIAWLENGDPAQHYLGWAFFRNSEWSLPPGTNPDFGLEIGSSIVYSDSIPLLALGLKPFGALLPDVFQYLGIWVVLCFVLQALFSWKIISLFVEDRVTIALGTAFLVFAPPMLWRLHGHIALFSHFLILAGIYLYLLSLNGRRILPFAILVAITALVHPYLCVMVAAIWAASFGDAVLRRRVKAREALVELLCVLGALAATSWAAGYFTVENGVASGGYGFYRMNLLSLVNSDGWSHLLRDIAGGPGDYEGFNFLGIGLIGLLILLATKSTRLAPTMWRAIRSAPATAFIAVFLFVFALSNAIGVGPVTWTFRIHEPVENLANIFRSSGRMFWPVYYAIVMAIILATIRVWTPGRARWILLIAVAAQIADISAGWGFRNPTQLLARPSSEWTSPMQGAFWDSAGKRYGQVRWVLTQNSSTRWRDVAYYALLHGMKTDAVYLARISQTGLQLGIETGRDSLYSGDYDGDTLYLLDEPSARTALSRLKDTDLMAVIDGFAVIAPGWKACPTCAQEATISSNSLFQPLPQDGVIDFRNGGGRSFLGDGWSGPEDWGLWSSGKLAELAFSTTLPDRVRLVLTGTAFGPNAEQEFRVSAGGPPVSFRLGHGLSELTVELDAGSNSHTIRFEIPSPISPQDLGRNTDIRKLGLGLISLRIETLAQ